MVTKSIHLVLRVFFLDLIFQLVVAAVHSWKMENLAMGNPANNNGVSAARREAKKMQAIRAVFNPATTWQICR